MSWSVWKGLCICCTGYGLIFLPENTCTADICIHKFVAWEWSNSRWQRLQKKCSLHRLLEVIWSSSFNPRKNSIFQGRLHMTRKHCFPVFQYLRCPVWHSEHVWRYCASIPYECHEFFPWQILATCHVVADSYLLQIPLSFFSLEITPRTHLKYGDSSDTLSLLCWN